MKEICDLHTHTVFSDGTYTPAEIISEAIEIGLSAVALCDHNTVDGIPDFLAAAKGKSIEAIAGSEFSVDYNGKELHLLGLYIPEDKLSIISDLMTEGHELKEQSNIDLVNAINNIGYEISYADIKAQSSTGRINRAHIAAELTRKGYTESIAQAFKTVLSKKAGYYIEPKRPDVYEMIEFVNSIGARPVLAHPFLNLSEAELKAFLPSAKECGLVGMECYYSLYDEELTDTSMSIAAELGLMPSGGSDFHGDHKPDIRLGFGKGNLKIPYEWAKAIKP